MTRLQERYETTVRPALMQEFGYKNPMQVPRLEKIVVNMGVGEAVQDSKKVDAAVGDLTAITGQHPVITAPSGRSRPSNCARTCRSACKVTLRARAHVRVSRPADHGGIAAGARFSRRVAGRSFDGRGNFALGLKEQLVFPEIDYDRVDAVRGMDVVVVTTAKTDAEAKALLKGFDMPFAN